MRYGLIGEHLGHSYSKEIHEMLGRYTYELKELAPDEIDAFMKEKDFEGINVTIPYKQTVIPYLDEIDPAAKAIGAVNTIVNKGGRLYGYNTDYYGMRTLLSHKGFSIRGSKVLILGSGGTSKTAMAVLTDMGAASIYKVSRRAAEGTITYEEALLDHTDADYIINTTPCGMYPNVDDEPIDIRMFSSLKGVADAIYNPLRTRLINRAQNGGSIGTGGLYMLVGQAIRAAELFIGETLDAGQLDSVFNKIINAKENIVLVGMPGSGKSTIGRVLAGSLGMELIDTDAMIVEKAGCPITEIFADKGEEYFRDLESEVIKEISLKTHCIIATGGGAVLRNINVMNLKLNGQLYFLNREPENISPTADRPLADDMTKVRSLYEYRLPIYTAAADHTLDVINTPEYMAEQIRRIRCED